MKENRTIKKTETIWRVNFLCLLLLSLFMSGCSYHDSQFSYFNMLDTEKRTQENQKAVEKFWSSTRPVSTLSASHYKLGRYYQQQKKYAKAVEQFSKAVRNDSRYCKAYNALGMSYDALTDCDLAYDAYERAVQCDPQAAYLYNNYGCSNILCGDYEKGLALLFMAEQLSGDNSRIKNNIKLAQRLVERKNNVGLSALHDATLALAPETALDQVGNEGQSAEASVEESVEDLQSAASTNTVVDTLVTEQAKKMSLQDQTVPAEQYAKGAVEVSNGNGVTGMARRSADYLRGYGFDIRRITNAKHFRFDYSMIYYKKGYLQLAKELAKVIPGAQNLEKVDALGRESLGVRILLGRDLVKMKFPEGHAGNAE